jgi:alpha-glucosidase
MSLDRSPNFSIFERTGPRITLRSTEGHIAHLFVLGEEIIRVMVLPDGHLRFPRTWAIAPGLDDVPYQGRDRFDLNGFTLPQFEFAQDNATIQITTKLIRLTVKLGGFFCRWETLQAGCWIAAAADRATQSYNFGSWDDRIYHYLKRDRDELYFGLGERAGNTNRAGQRYRMTNIDAMGYDAASSDPLYKHIPFYITWNQSKKVGFGLLYDTVADCTFDFGRELDNYHGRYRYFVAEHGDLDYYFIAGPAIADVVRRFTWMTGCPAFMPKWSLGYSGSTMSYTDEPKAQERMNDFLVRCEEHDILCDSFHLSSGYTSTGDKRYVFNWNRNKFPDPANFIKRYMEHGVRLCANIKPCLLHDHPRFAEAAAKGLLVCDRDGNPELVQFWGELGAYLDFTNPAAAAWWKARVTDSLLAYGIAATWNDNNEFEIWNPTARVHGFGENWPAAQAKTLQTLLMIRASWEAQREFVPRARPFLVTRAGAVGLHRYAQTWSGDNYTSWETLRYNIKMGIGLALSGVSNIGHDVGGFAGPAPEPELFLRWVQFGIFMPRFTIHSWNDDSTVNEPWMYPDITPWIRDLIKFRYQLIPYIYDLLWRYHRDCSPIIRPTFYDFPDDEHCYAENDDMMLGENLLVAAVVERGDRTRKVYLPKGAGWYDFWSGAIYDGGQEITLAAPWEHTPLLVREGSAIPLNIAEQHFSKRADRRGFAIFPHRAEGSFVCECFEDDGESQAYLEGNFWNWRLIVDSSNSDLSIHIERLGEVLESEQYLELVLPVQETRRVRLDGGVLLKDECDGLGPRRLRVRCGQ